MSTIDHRLTRREMLIRSSHAVAIGALAAEYRPLLAAPQSRWFKIGACDWSLGKMADTAAFDVAKEIGLDGVQVSLGTLAGGMKLCTPETQKAYRDACRKTGLEIGSIAIGEMNNVPLKSDPRAAQWLLDGIDACKALGVKVVMPACFGKGNLDMAQTHEIDHLVKVLKEASAKAEKQGVLIGLEDYLSAEDNMKIIERVGSPALRVYYDVGNSTDKGYDIFKEIRLLGKLICEFHAKDANHRLGQGRIDFKAVRKAMDDIEYSGWIHLESSHPKGVVPDYTTDCKYLKGIFPLKG
jgi:sugar phosphate isomerase/epimerase